MSCRSSCVYRLPAPFLTAHRGNTVWHIESQRYLGPDTREIRQTLRVEIKPMEEGVFSPFLFRYEDTPQVCTSSPALTRATADEHSLLSASAAVPSDPLVVAIIRQARRLDLLGIGRIILQWTIGMLSLLISGPIYLTPFIPLLLLLVPPTGSTD